MKIDWNKTALSTEEVTLKTRVIVAKNQLIDRGLMTREDGPYCASNYTYIETVVADGKSSMIFMDSYGQIVSFGD